MDTTFLISFTCKKKTNYYLMEHVTWIISFHQSKELYLVSNCHCSAQLGLLKVPFPFVQVQFPSQVSILYFLHFNNTH